MADKEGAERRTNVYAAVGVGFVCLAIGLPLWWKTTEVYRVSLPYSDIDSLARADIQYSVDVNVIIFEKIFGTEVLPALSKQLMESLDSRSQTGVKSHYRTFVTESSTTDQEVLVSSRTVSDLDSRLTKSQSGKANEYYVYVLSESNSVHVDKPTVGLHRSVFVPSSGKDMTLLVDIIALTVQSALVRESTIVKRYNTARGARNLKPDKEMMRSVKFSTGYDITLTLVSPRPDILDVQWEAEDGINGKISCYTKEKFEGGIWKPPVPFAYMGPLIESMSKYNTITVKSQVLFFTKLQVKPKKNKDEYFFTRKELPHMINPLEAKLGSPASTNPELNFLVYVPSGDQYPLYIRDDQGNKVESNSFLSPQWGGIYIYNVAPPSANSTLPEQKILDMGRIMEVFLAQLRLLLNLQTQERDDVVFLPVAREAVTDWELDRWLRTRCVENLATSAATLNSLAKLLAKISNIVINDDIGNEVQQAISAMRQTHLSLVDGDLVEAYLQSRNAIQASEKAFFDPSLLELLYFPEDQKFAIYIPLFLPISFPVLASLWQSYKWFRGQDKPKKD